MSSPSLPLRSKTTFKVRMTTTCITTRRMPCSDRLGHICYISELRVDFVVPQFGDRALFSCRTQKFDVLQVGALLTAGSQTCMRSGRCRM